MFSHGNDRQQRETRLYGMYRGEVIDNVDPINQFRVKIRVFHVYDDIPDAAIPWAQYSDPFMSGRPGMGSSFTPEVGAHVWVFFEQGYIDQPVLFAGAPARGDGPEEARQMGEYPYNKVIKTLSGHTIELDDSPEQTRVRIAHNSGTQFTINHAGDKEEVVVGDLNILVEQDANITVLGDVTESVGGDVIREVSGNVTEMISGDYITSIGGRRKEQSNDGSEYISTGRFESSGSQVHLNRGGGAAVSVEGGQFVYSPQYAYTFSAARDLVQVAGTNAPFDTPEDEELKQQAIASGDFPEEAEPDREPEDVEVDDEDVAELDPDCPTPEDDVYATPIGTAGLTVRSGTLSPVFPHSLQAQRGLTVPEIICNMNALAVNIVDPFLAQFPNMRINSWFRRGEGGSFHNIGGAVDFQSPTAPGDKELYREMLEWIAQNLPYDQCIIESTAAGPNAANATYWIHIGYDRGGTQRKERLTYFGGRSPAYTQGWGV